MSLSPTIARCDGGNCPSQRNCKRYLQRQMTDGCFKAALWLRREAGASACDLVIWDKPVTTYVEADL